MRISDWSSDVCSSDLAERDLRHLRLSGTGDAGRPDTGGLFAWRSRSAAPRDGQEDSGGDGRPAVAVRAGLRRPADQRGEGERTVRLDRQVRGLWLQQEPRRCICAGRLSHRLAEGARSEEHTSELQSLMRSSYAVFCLKKKTNKQHK